MAKSRKPGLRQVLAANVRRERLAQDLSQEALADSAGLSQTYVSLVESGKPAASIDAIEQLAIALAIEPHELLRR